MTATAHVAMMQKDEGVILARWLEHYAALFGYEALSIYDNFSTDPLTSSLLFDAEAAGVRVYRNKPVYRDKNILILNLFKKHDARAGRADFYIPVDCDEYLVALTSGGVSYDRAVILAELARHKLERRSLQIPGSFYNDPGQDGRYVLDRPFIKSFFRSGAIGTLDTGFHFGSSGLDNGIVETRLIYLHHHNKELSAARETARGKLRMAEAADPNGEHAHYLRWLINCGEEEYRNRYENRLRVTLPRNAPARLVFPDGTTVEWNEQAYFAHNPDIAPYALGGLLHFMAEGYRDRRFPSPEAW